MPGLALLSAISAAAALRVASLDLCADEYVLLLARPAQIASVSRLSQDPGDSPLWKKGRGFPANRGTLETALASRPTLVVATGGGGKSTGAIARKLGIAALNLPYPNSIDEVAVNMRRVAGALGDPRRAEAWIGRLDRIRANAPKPRDAIFLGGGGESFAQGSLGAQWMRLAGLTQRRLPGGRTSLETLALHPPSVLLISDYRRKQMSLGQRWLDHPLVQRAHSRRLLTDGRPWTCSGPLMLHEIARLQSLR